MKNEFEPRDIQYKKLAGMFDAELKGPSLKKMDANKRVQIA